MNELELDQWSNAITLFLMSCGFVYLTYVLIRRTKRWNGVGRSLTALMAIVGILDLQGSWNWLERINQELPSLPIWWRVGTRVLAIVAIVWAIYKVKTVELVAIKDGDE